MIESQIAGLDMELLRDPKQLAQRLQSQRAASGAREFEAALFSSVLDKMEKNLSLEDSQSDDPGHDTVTALGVRAMSQALAQKHVLGIAAMIERSLGIDSSSGSPGLGSLSAETEAKHK